MRLDLTDIVKKDGNYIDWQFTRHAEAHACVP
jgi:hypothetical protein